MREKWRVRCGWIKMHVMIDVETNQVLGLEIIDEFVQDDWVFVPLLDQAQQHCGEEHPVYRVLADGAYDRNELFSILEQRGIASGIKTRPMPRLTRLGHPIGPNTSETETDGMGI